MNDLMRKAFSYYYRKSKDPNLYKYLIYWPHFEFQNLPVDFQFWWNSHGSKVIEQFEIWKSSKINWCDMGSSEYPIEYLNLERPPFGFFYQGEACWMNKFRLAVVGARAISPVTKDWMQTELVDFLTQFRGCTVSGGARGVDHLLHLQSLRKGVPTIVFLPSGIERMYPPELKDLRSDIVAGGGAIISELDSGEEMRTFHFHRRNQLLVQISSFVLVTQAEQRSGSHMSAKLAIGAGREIGTLPAGPWDKAFSANLELLRSGVTMISDARDLSVVYAKQNVPIVKSSGNPSTSSV